MKTIDYIKKLNGLKFFILDTNKGTKHNEDYKKYSYNKYLFNKLTVGSIFIYRRPIRTSENKKFYFFGGDD